MKKLFSYTLTTLLILAVALSGCGGGSSPTPVTLTMIAIPVPTVGGLTFPTDNDNMTMIDSANGETSNGTVGGAGSPTLTITVSKAYEIAQTEVTYRQWSVVYTWALSHGYTFDNPGGRGGYREVSEYVEYVTYGSGHEADPVTTVSWRDAMVWCNALTEYYNAQHGKSYTCVYTKNGSGGFVVIRDSRDSNATACDNVVADSAATGFRLPTNNEWELAARYIADFNSDGDICEPGEFYPGNHVSGDTTGYCYPSDGGTSTAFSNYAWYWANSLVGGNHSTQPVATGSPNASVLYDMSGNVWEWCFDWHPEYIGSSRVMRGGSWDVTNTSSLQLGIVNSGNPGFAFNFHGFRPARTL